MEEHKLSDNDHGNRFQSKLVFLFFIRAINKGYKKFRLATELDKFGGKFDDLIFIREDDTQDGVKSYLYLQAKHGLHEKPHSKAKSITTAHLLNDNKGDFSLVKYFHSYRDCITKASEGPQREDQVDCVICTNKDFDWNEFPNSYRVPDKKLCQLLDGSSNEPEGNSSSNIKISWLLQVLCDCKDSTPPKKPKNEKDEEDKENDEFQNDFENLFNENFKNTLENTQESLKDSEPQKPLDKEND